MSTQALQRLADAVEALAVSGESGLSHAGLARATVYLADALAFFPDGREEVVEKLRAAAQQVETSSSPLRYDSALLKDALTSAERLLLERRPPPGRLLDYNASVQALARALAAIDVAKRPLEQGPEIASVFRAAADAIYLAEGADPPFGEAEAAGAQPENVPDAQESLDEARSDVLALGRSRWANIRPAAARALFSLATALEAVDLDHSQRERISKIRLEAERVRSAAALSFGLAEWIKAGLEMILDAFDAVYGDDEVTVAPWTRSARQAVASIDEQQSFTFQRAAVQDGFRAICDAFLAAAQSEQL